MTVGSSQKVASCPLYDDAAGQPQYRHSFQRDCQSGLEMSGTAAVVVTRTDSQTWVVEPDHLSLDATRVFGITTKGRVLIQDFGRYSMPFKMTLKDKRTQ